MRINQREASTKAATPSTADRPRVGLLALALAVSWATMLFHNQSELPLTPLDLENTGPLVFAIALLIAAWWRPRSRVIWATILAWGVVNMVIGGVVTVLPLPVLPFAPEQTIEHYAVHAVYTIGQLPLILLAGHTLRQLTRQKQRISAQGG